MSGSSGRDDPMAASHNEHADRWNDDLAAFTLDALEPNEAAAVIEHLSGCGICAERLRWMTPAVDVLPATVRPVQPPPALKSRIMDVVDRESAMIASADDPGRAAREEGRDSARRLPSFLDGLSLRPVLAGLGVFLVLAAGVTGYAINGGGSESGSEQVYAAKPDQRDSIASGRLVVAGDQGSLHVTNLPATTKGEVYQAWVQDTGVTGGSIHPSSVFVVSEGGVGDVAIPHGLSTAKQVMVTREPKGGSEHPSENPLLTAVIG